MAARAAIILAAGQGTRMRSSLPKVLHKVGGRPMVDWSIELAKRVGCERIIVVARPDGAEVQQHVTAALGENTIAIQDPPLGTGHAVLSAKESLSEFEGDVVVLYGDTPLIPATAVERLFEELEGGARVGVLGFDAAIPGAYGRLVTGDKGDLEAIVEAKDATPEQLGITLCNSGVMAARSTTLFGLLELVTNDNAKGEYYLTDIVGLARSDGGLCRAVKCSEDDVLGVNSRVELSEAEISFQTRRRAELLVGGVTMTAPETVFLSYDTIIENDVTIEPNVVFGPGVTIESDARIRAHSHLEGCHISRGATIGPFARLRPGAEIAEDVHIGNFVEIKAAQIDEGAKINHLSYVGDARVGSNSNIGAGTITCNYDGVSKNQTDIGQNVFIGSNTMLVAPVTVGDNAVTASGTVLTQDVPADALAISRVGQVNKTGIGRKLMDSLRLRKSRREKGS